MTRNEFLKKYHPDWKKNDFDNCYKKSYFNYPAIVEHLDNDGGSFIRFELFADLPIWVINELYEKEEKEDSAKGWRSFYTWLFEDPLTEDDFKKYERIVKFKGNPPISNLDFFANDLAGALKKYDEDYKLILEFSKKNPKNDYYTPSFWEWVQYGNWRDPNQNVCDVYAETTEIMWIYG